MKLDDLPRRAIRTALPNCNNVSRSKVNKRNIMDSEIQQLIEAMHASGRQVVVAATGGGATAIGQLTGVPGASRTLLEGLSPYSAASLNEFLGAVPESACSAATSRRIAMAAWSRAKKLVAEMRSGLVGIGCTATLASDRPKRGDHRVHVSWQTESATGTLTLTLTKGARTRWQEEGIACRLVLNAIASAIDLPHCEIDLIGDEHIDEHAVIAPSEWSELLLRHRTCIASGIDANELGSTVVVSGSFNPMHAGHRGIADVAKRLTGRRAVYELSLTNVDKPALDFVDLTERVKQFGESPYVITTAPTFVEKARLMPGCIFAVGIDTITRIGNPVYYAGDEARLQSALSELAHQNCRFLVFGRLMEGKFQGLEDIELPSALRALCDGIAETEFREDVSSTELRESS